jgi:hypothetical protein
MGECWLHFMWSRVVISTPADVHEDDKLQVNSTTRICDHKTETVIWKSCRKRESFIVVLDISLPSGSKMSHSTTFPASDEVTTHRVLGRSRHSRSKTKREPDIARVITWSRPPKTPPNHGSCLTPPIAPYYTPLWDRTVVVPFVCDVEHV